MNTVTVKIVEWDEESQSLICSFASDETNSSDPDTYGKLAFQPAMMWPDVTDSDELLKKIAQAGKSVCEEIKIKETIASDNDKKSLYTNLVGTNTTYNVSDIT